MSVNTAVIELWLIKVVTVTKVVHVLGARLLSTAEAEIIALSEAAKEVIYFRKFLRGVNESYITGPTRLETDSKAAFDLSYNPEHHGRTKHVARRHFFVRDQVEEGEISVRLVKTDDNAADFCSKPLKPSSFFSLRDLIMNVSHA